MYLSSSPTVSRGVKLVCSVNDDAMLKLLRAEGFENNVVVGVDAKVGRNLHR
jgi:hypothetical protein